MDVLDKTIDEKRQGEALSVDSVLSNTKKLYLESYGCQMNLNDSEIVASILSEEGYNTTHLLEDADLVLVNTCSIREKAEKTVRKRLEKYAAVKKINPSMKVGVLGCMAQSLKDDILENKPYVDIVLGPDSYRRLPEILKRYEKDEQSLVDTQLSKYEVYDDLFPNRKDGVNAWVTIMRGCDKFCTFCIVPFTRGRERSSIIHPQKLLHLFQSINAIETPL